jgi:hypothetical protein
MLVVLLVAGCTSAVPQDDLLCCGEALFSFQCVQQLQCMQQLQCAQLSVWGMLCTFRIVLRQQWHQPWNRTATVLNQSLANVGSKWRPAFVEKGFDVHLAWTERSTEGDMC